MTSSIHRFLLVTLALAIMFAVLGSAATARADGLPLP